MIIREFKSSTPNDYQLFFELRRDPDLLLRLDCQVAGQVQIAHFLNAMRILSQRINIPTLFQKTEHKEPLPLISAVSFHVSKDAEGHRGQNGKAASWKICTRDTSTYGASSLCAFG